jgi:hypothetical protein
MVSPKGMPNIPAEASGKGTPYQQAKVDGAPALSAVTPMADIVGRRNGLLEQRSEKGGIMFTHERAAPGWDLTTKESYFSMQPKICTSFQAALSLWRPKVITPIKQPTTQSRRQRSIPLHLPRPTLFQHPTLRLKG